MSPRAEARAFGETAEEAAADFLVEKGYRILARKFVIRGGEIDIIAAGEGVVVFVEVKARGKLETALEAISESQRRRLARAASAWVARHPWAGQDWSLRGDAIFLDARRPPLHIEDAYPLEFED